MKKRIIAMVLLLLPLLGSGAVASESYYGTNHVLSAPAAGQPGSTAIHMSSNAIVAWADGYLDMQYGEAVDEIWTTPEKALGPAEGTSFDIVSLGRGGQITLT
ncbi:MAG: PEP-CTERM sorting domain-containing protein, partial [Verrucomicrobia bacterium]|nr:PEP-CTERM sorting domain-containing protein [Verrucomicrobiota bacterium]